MLFSLTKSDWRPWKRHNGIKPTPTRTWHLHPSNQLPHGCSRTGEAADSSHSIPHGENGRHSCKGYGRFMEQSWLTLFTQSVLYGLWLWICLCGQGKTGFLILVMLEELYITRVDPITVVLLIFDQNLCRQMIEQLRKVPVLSSSCLNKFFGLFLYLVLYFKKSNFSRFWWPGNWRTFEFIFLLKTP